MSSVHYQQLMTVFNLAPFGHHVWSLTPNAGFQDAVFVLDAKPILVADHANVKIDKVSRYVNKSPSPPVQRVAVGVKSQSSDTVGYTLFAAAITA